jgi:hypothetical protein
VLFCARFACRAIVARLRVSIVDGLAIYRYSFLGA